MKNYIPQNSIISREMNRNRIRARFVLTMTRGQTNTTLLYFFNDYVLDYVRPIVDLTTSCSNVSFTRKTILRATTKHYY